VLGIEAGLRGRSVGICKLDDESETMEVDIGGSSTKDDDDVTIDTSSESPMVATRQKHEVLQEKPVSSGRPSPSPQVQGQKTV